MLCFLQGKRLELEEIQYVFNFKSKLKFHISGLWNVDNQNLFFMEQRAFKISKTTNYSCKPKIQL